jgi:short-subunit dehydrogenase
LREENEDNDLGATRETGKQLAGQALGVGEKVVESGRDSSKLEQKHEPGGLNPQG